MRIPLCVFILIPYFARVYETIMSVTTPSQNPDRRSFFKKTLSVVIGGIITLVPITAGIFVYLDPLRRKSKVSGAVRVAALSALPNDSIPRKFPVIAAKEDAWNKYPNVPIGAVYLRRTGEKIVQAFNVVCPHAGCFVDYLPERNTYLCPCHNSTFALDGTVSEPKSPSPRGLDNLEVEIRGEEIFVKFQNFRTGEAKRIPAV